MERALDGAANCGLRFALVLWVVLPRFITPTPLTSPAGRLGGGLSKSVG